MASEFASDSRCAITCSVVVRECMKCVVYVCDSDIRERIETYRDRPCSRQY